MKRNFTRVDRVAQMTMQEELIAKKKQEILEKQRTKEIGKQIAAAQKNVATSICTLAKDTNEEEEKQPSETKETSTTPSPALHPLIAAANIPKLQNNFCNDGSFFEYYKKIIEQTKQEEEAKKQAEAKLKNEMNILTEEEVKTESQIIQSDVISNVMVEDVNEFNEQKNIEIKNEVTENKTCEDENMNKEVENSLIKEDQEQTQSNKVKTEIIDTVNVNCQETLVCAMNSSNTSAAPPSPYNEPLKQYNIKAENQHYNQSFPANNAPSIPVTTRPNFLPGHFPTQLTSQSNAMPLHMPSAFSMPPNTAFNLNLPPPMINFAIQQPAPPPPPPPMPVLLPLPQPAPNLFQSSFSNPSIFLMQHQTPPQITIPYQQQTQQMSLPQQQPQPVQIIQNSPLQQVTQVAVSQPSPVTLQPSPVTLQPAPVTLQPAPATLQPAPVTLQSSPITLQPSPITLQTSTEISQSSQPSPVAQTFQQPFHTAEITQSSASTDDIQDNLSRNDDDIEEMKTEIKSSSNSDQQSYDSNRSNTNSPVIEKDIKNAVFSEDSKPIDQTKSLLPTSLQSCIEMVADNGDAFEDFIRSKKDEVHSSLWFLFDMESDEYAIYRQSIVKIREEIRNKKRQAIYKSNDEKYDPESVCDDRDDNDSDDEYMKGMLNRNTNNLKRRIETRVEFEEEERRQAEEERQKKRKSRWGEKIDSNSVPTVTAVVQTSFANQNKPMLSNIQRTDPALLQYAKLNYGGINLSEEEWNKCEEHFKVNLLYQDMMRKRREIDQLAQSGKFKYEYDSDEDTEGGTWEHKLRMAEMEATNAWASALTKQSEGKHHIGDFLPPEELKKFMEQYEAKKNNRQPDLSDYKEFKLKEDNKGFQMLQKLGWQEGQGLGAGGDGIVDPINKATQREANQGLGANSASTPGDGDNEYEAYRKRMMLAYRFRPNPLNNPRRAYY